MSAERSAKKLAVAPAGGSLTAAATLPDACPSRSPPCLCAQLRALRCGKGAAEGDGTERVLFSPVPWPRDYGGDGEAKGAQAAAPWKR